MQIIKDFWSVCKTRHLLEDTDVVLMFTILGANIGVCLVCITEYNTLGLTGWLAITVYWFIEITKLNHKDNNLILGKSLNKIFLKLKL